MIAQGSSFSYSFTICLPSVVSIRSAPVDALQHGEPVLLGEIQVHLHAEQVVDGLAHRAG